MTDSSTTGEDPSSAGRSPWEPGHDAPSAGPVTEPAQYGPPPQQGYGTDYAHPGFAQPGYPQPPVGYGQPPVGYGQPPVGYPQPPVGYPPPYGYAPPQRGTNGLSIASMVLGIIWLWWVGSILAVIFGHVALSQIKRRGDNGRGMAIAGLVLGYIGIGTLALFLLVGVVGELSDSSY